MTVSKRLDRLDVLSTLPRKPITRAWALSIMGRLNAQYEALFDAAAPGASGQTITGHDHADEGGGPVLRSSQMTIDAGDSPVLTYTFTTAERLFWDFGPAYVSPGVGASDLSVRMDVALYMSATGGDVRVWAGFGESEKVALTAATEATDGQWVRLAWPVTVEADYQFLTIWIEPAEWQPGTSITVTIYAVDAAESHPLSTRRIGWRNLLDDLGDVAISSVYSYFGTDAKLDDGLVDLDWMALSAYFWKVVFWSANALYEGLYDRAAPGSTAAAIRGHDHSATNLGRVIGQGCIYSGGNTHGAAGWLSATLGTVNQWEYADLDAAYRRTNGTPNVTTGAGSTDPFCHAYVTAGMTSSGAPPSATPYLDAWIYVEATDSTTTVEARLYNQTTSTRSQAVVVTNSTWTYIRFVPCSGGAWNEFDIQIRRTDTTSSNVVAVKGLRIFEAYKYGGNLGAYVASSGSAIGGRPRSGTEKEPVT